MVRGFGYSANRSVSGWMTGGGGRMGRGWTSSRSGESNFNFKGFVRAPGFLSVAMGLCGEFITARSRMIVFLGGGVSHKPNGVPKPLHPARRSRLIGRFLDPTLWTRSAGTPRVRICALPRTPPLGSSLRNNGNCVLRHRTRPLGKLPIANCSVCWRIISR